MSLSTTVIIIFAVCGGVVVVGLIGTTVGVLCWRRRRRRLRELEDARNGQQTDAHSASQGGIAYMPPRDDGGKRAFGWRFGSWERKKGQLMIAQSKSMEDLSSSHASSRVASIIRDSRYRQGSSDSAANTHQSGGLKATPGPTEVHVPAGAPSRPLTPIAEKDAPDSNRRIFTRQGYHLPGNPRGWRYLTRTDRSSSPRCFSDSTAKSLSEADRRRNGTGSNNMGVLRSLSFNTQSPGPVPDRCLPPTPEPDVIYDACSRLGPPLSSNPAKNWRGQFRAGRDILTPDSMGSSLDSNGEPDRTSGYFLSALKPPGRRPKTRRAFDESLREDFPRRQEAFPTSIEATGAGRAGSSSDRLDVGEEPSLTLRREKSSSMSLSLHDNWQTPVKTDGDFTTAQPPDHIGPNHGKDFPEQPSNKGCASPYLSPRKRKTGRGRPVRQALQESTDGLNRQSSASSPSSPIPPPKPRHTRRRSREERTARTKSASTRSLDGKRLSHTRSLLQPSRPSSVATSAILEGEVYNASPPRHRGTSQALNSRSRKHHQSCPPSTPVLHAEVELEAAMRSVASSLCGDADSDTSALWSVLDGESRQPSPNRKHTSRQTCLASPSRGSEDTFQPSTKSPRSDQNVDNVAVHIGHCMQAPELSPSQHEPSEIYDVDPIPPLRPRNSALSIHTLPPPTRDSALNSSPPNSPEHRAAGLAINQVLRPRSSGIGTTSRDGALTQSRPQTSHGGAGRSALQTRPSQDSFRHRHGLLPYLNITPPVHDGIRPTFRIRHSPPTEPLPAPPPLPVRSHARMTSMMMALRRQNSESSRCDSTYFHLPQSQRGSKASFNSAQTSQLLADTTDGEQDTSPPARPVNLRHVSESSLLARRAATAKITSNDPFVESTRKSARQSSANAEAERRPRSSQRSPQEPTYLPGYTPTKPRPRSSGRARTASMRKREKAQEKSLELERSFLIECAIGLAGEPLIVEDDPDMLAHRQHRYHQYEQLRDLQVQYSEQGNVASATTDDSELDLSPMGKSIMAAKRREHFDRQRGAASPTGPEDRIPLSSFARAPGQEQKQQRQEYLQTQQSPTNIPPRGHSRFNSSISSIGALSSETASSDHSRQLMRMETTRQRVNELKERVASMQFPKKGKAAGGRA